uniref:Cyclin B and related kinase-activating proteins n=1 Tax=Hirondellea gigas TaxID=1518452 RepID=A0A6A7FX12_9CRUS
MNRARRSRKAQAPRGVLGDITNNVPRPAALEKKVQTNSGTKRKYASSLDSSSVSKLAAESLTPTSRFHLGTPDSISAHIDRLGLQHERSSSLKKSSKRRLDHKSRSSRSSPPSSPSHSSDPILDPRSDIGESVEWCDRRSPIKSDDGTKMADYQPVEVSIPDCDLADSDPQYPLEYLPEILAHYRKKETREAVSPEYISLQPDIDYRMRAVLVDWLVEVHHNFKLVEPTLFLTINIVDRFLSRRRVTRAKLQLVGCASMLLASKYQEIFAPEIMDFVYISAAAYDRDDIIKMEQVIISTINFSLSVITPYQFAMRFVRVSQTNETIKFMVLYILELSFMNLKFLSYRPSMMAATALFIALKLIPSSSWSKTLEEQTGYSVEQMNGCLRDCYQLLTVPNRRAVAIAKKFSSSKVCRVSQIQWKRST